MAPRRLPVLQNVDAADAAAERRPPATWVAVVALLTVTIWLPCLAALPWLERALGGVGVPAPARGAIASLGSFALAAAVAGAVVGRFGGASGRREAGLGALAAAGVVTLLGQLGGAHAEAAHALVALVAFGLAGPAGAVPAALLARAYRDRWRSGAGRLP